MAVDRRMSACRRKWSEDIVVAVIGKTGPVGAGLRGGFLGQPGVAEFLERESSFELNQSWRWRGDCR